MTAAGVVLRALPAISLWKASRAHEGNDLAESRPQPRRASTMQATERSHTYTRANAHMLLEKGASSRPVADVRRAADVSAGGKQEQVRATCLAVSQGLRQKQLRGRRIRRPTSRVRSSWSPQKHAGIPWRQTRESSSQEEDAPW
jgi:hypothetical protein